MPLKRGCRRLALTSLLAASAPIAGSEAADLSPPTTWLSNTPAISWRGLYVGVNLGGSITSNYNADTQGDFRVDGVGAGLVPVTLDTGTGGLSGGWQAGYNFQSGNMVLGLVTDFELLQASGGSSATSKATQLGATLTTTASERLEYIGSARLRLGYAFGSRLLAYLTGGLAYGEVRNAESIVANGASGVGWYGDRRDFRAGYSFGGGVEYALTDAISLDAEVLYYNLGSTLNGVAPNPAAQANSALAGFSYVNKTTAAGDLLRAGVNYRF